MSTDNHKSLKQLGTALLWTWRIGSGAVQLGVNTYQLAKALKPAPTPKPIDKMLGFAMGKELSPYTYDPEGFYLGRIHSDHGVNFEASLPANDDRHVFIVAGSASGKGVSLGLQNGLRWLGPLFAIDPKGEMAEITANRRARRAEAKKTGTSVRKHLEQKIGILDPRGEVQGAAKKFRVNYDPMRDIDPHDKRGATRRIKKLAAGMIIPEVGENAHFSESAETIIAGVIEAVIFLEARHNHCLPFVRQKILGNKAKTQNGTRRETAFDGIDRKLLTGAIPTPEEDKQIKIGFEALFNYLDNPRLPVDGHAAEAVSILAEVIDTNEGSSFRTTLSRNLKWLIDPDMKDHLQHADFSLWKAIQEGWSIFVVLNPDDIGDFRNWLRMTTQMALSAKMDMGKNQQGRQTLFFLDEFPVLGRFREIEEKAGYIRGYGVKLVPIIQNIGQIIKLYEKNWETFLGNAGAIIAWGFNDLETEQYFSNRLGKITVEQRSVSQSSNIQGLGASHGWNEQTGQHDHIIRFPNQLREEGSRETMRAFVIRASGKAFMIERVDYRELEGQGMYDSLEHIQEWEKRYG